MNASKRCFGNRLCGSSLARVVLFAVLCPVCLLVCGSRGAHFSQTASSADKGDATATRMLNAIVRDFSDTHPDFEDGISGVVKGLVQSNLAPDNKPVFAGPNGRGAIRSQEGFNQWFNDVPAVNQKITRSLELRETKPGSGIFSFESSAFFPIDNQLLGNQGRTHNYHFTLEVHDTFTFRGGEMLKFKGDDDLWVFIDKRLVVDVGGVHAVASGSVKLDTLGLTVGQSYAFDLFFAERHTSQSNFELQTSIALEANQPPVVSAGPDQTITLPASANLGGSATDDGVPAGGTLTVSWTKVSGPGDVTFANPNQLATTAAFGLAGTHVLRLTANDSLLTSSDDVTITVNSIPGVNQPPVVDPGPDQNITLPDGATLNGKVTDDGLPAGGTLGVSWSKLTGPGTVTFGNANVATTTATFSEAGTYVLRLSGSDTASITSADVTILVRPAGEANQAPTVNTGPDQVVSVSGFGTLNGTVSDDGLPVGGTLTVSWSKVSGPGVVTFVDPNRPVTSVTFCSAGTYVLRLTASDSLLTSTDEVTIEVATTPPVFPLTPGPRVQSAVRGNA